MLPQTFPEKKIGTQIYFAWSFFHVGIPGSPNVRQKACKDVRDKIYHSTNGKLVGLGPGGLDSDGIPENERDCYLGVPQPPCPKPTMFHALTIINWKNTVILGRLCIIYSNAFWMISLKHRASWNSKQPFFNGWKWWVNQKFSMIKIWIHQTETSILIRGCLGFPDTWFFWENI